MIMLSEIEMINKEAISCLLLPSIQGVNIKLNMRLYAILQLTRLLAQLKFDAHNLSGCINCTTEFEYIHIFHIKVTYEVTDFI